MPRSAPHEMPSGKGRIAMTGWEAMSRVSVILPVRDGEATIETAVQALLGQDHPRECFEIIVVDNGSRDRTSSILGKYSANIRIVQEEKRGASAARNAGI